MSTLKFVGGESRIRRCTEFRDAKPQRERRQREGDSNGARGCCRDRWVVVGVAGLSTENRWKTGTKREAGKWRCWKTGTEEDGFHPKNPEATRESDVGGSDLGEEIGSRAQFSSITSVTILDCWTVVWVIILTWIFLGTKYSLWQFFGAALCVSGLCLVLLSDSGVGGSGGPNPVLGDILVIVGTCFFALSNVGEEFCVKRVDRVEVLTMLGLFGMLSSVVEMTLFERKSLGSVSWSPEVILTFVGYGISGFMFCSLTPLVLQASGATLFNLSLLTADMWAVLIRVFFYHQKVDWLYYVSFVLVGIGLVIYSKTEKHSDDYVKLENGVADQRYTLLPQEAVQV